MRTLVLVMLSVFFGGSAIAAPSSLNHRHTFQPTAFYRAACARHNFSNSFIFGQVPNNKIWFVEFTSGRFIYLYNSEANRYWFHIKEDLDLDVVVDFDRKIFTYYYRMGAERISCAGYIR